jgi:hypothetical protein
MIADNKKELQLQYENCFPGSPCIGKLSAKLAQSGDIRIFASSTSPF